MTLGAARALSGRIRELAPAIEAARTLPPELVDDLRRAGVFGMWLPRELSGAETSPDELVRVVEVLSEADGSTGWCAAVAAGFGAVAAFLPEEGAREMYGGGGLRGPNARHSHAVTAGSLAPRGRAEAVDGGYRVTGRWSFGSGSLHADWLGGTCVLVDEGGAPVTLDDGRPDARLMFLPAADVTVADNWDVSGLRGTGSHDYSVDGAFVPARRTTPFSFQPWPAGPLWRMPPMSLFFAPLAAVPLGIARAAIGELTALAAEKTPYRSSRRLAERDVVQAMVAEAEAAVRSARAFLREALDEVWVATQLGEEVSLRQRALVRLAVLNASRAGCRAVDLCYEAGGATSIQATSPLQRQFRDVHAASQHVVLTFSGWETVGRVLLGLEPDTPLL